MGLIRWRVPALPYRHPATLLATLGGVGLCPKAPGTCGSVATLPVAAVAHWLGGPLAVLSLALSATLLGWWATACYMKNLPKDADPSEVVVDEMAGLALVLAVMPLSWIGYIAGFVAFRLFDIWKPAFIGWCDRNVKGPWGVMLDDLAAALPAALLASPVWFL